MLLTLAPVMTNMAYLRRIGPRLVNTYHLSKILPGSHDPYKKCVLNFLSVIIKFRFRFNNFLELYDLLVEYDYTEVPT